MRTTIQLDDDLAERLRAIAHTRRESLQKVVNEILRRGLSAQVPRPGRETPFKVDTFDSPFRAGADLLKLNQLGDEIEIRNTMLRR